MDGDNSVGLHGSFASSVKGIWFGFSLNDEEFERF